ncbi:MAG TPA: hypothetical protein VLW55_25900 [Burkholderiaceae bacterium]|nr:hypothetical protein [Burkholderiaceae bacterium]
MKRLIPAATLALTLVIAQAALAQNTQGAAASGPGVVAAGRSVEAAATITAIDKATRTIKLKGAKGDVHSIVAGPEVKNFDKLKVGDNVVAKYVEALVVELKKGGGEPLGMTESSGTAASKPGESPGAGAARQVKLVGNVVGLDAMTQTVTLKGKTRTVDMQVRDPEQFKLISIGDQIQATYTEAVAVAVEPKKDAKK